MAESNGIPQRVKEQMERIGSADLVIGLPGSQSAQDLEWVIGNGRAGRPLIAEGVKTIVVHPDSITPETVGEDEFADVRFLAYPWAKDRFPALAADGRDDPVHGVFQVSQAMAARACCVWNSNPNRITALAMQWMVRPALYQDFDLVVPRYKPLRFGSLINSGILYPFTRALYGKRITYPMAHDLGFSARFISRLVEPEPRRTPRSPQWTSSQAVCGGFQVCQVNLGMEPPTPEEPPDLSTVLSQVLGSLFSDVERYASFWQRANGSQSVPTFGEAGAMTEEHATVEVQRMIETFQLASRNLAEVWSVALPPATLLELKKLTRAAPENFHLADDVWVRIVYDFALGHRQRSISRDHLLRSMTPLYLAWVASYALQVRDAPGWAVQDRLEQLALAYERGKPYLLARWRWPDRFSP